MLIAQLNLEPTWRGGEKQAFLLSKELKARGIPQVLIAHPDGALWDRAREFVPTLIPLRRRAEWDLHAAWRLQRILKSVKPDILHVHTAHDAALAAMAKQGLPVRLVVTRTVDFPLRDNPFSRWKYRQADRIVAVSHAVGEVLKAQGIAGEKVSVVYTCVDLEEVQKIRERLAMDGHLKRDFLKKIRAPESACLVGMLAALTDQKDPLMYVEVAALCVRKNARMHFVLVGTGPMHKRVQSQAELFKLEEHFTMLGFRPDAIELMSLMDCVALTSANEGLPTTILEAMALGVPVVATDVGGVREALRHGETGFLVASGDSSGMAKFLLQLAQDLSLRRHMGQKARKSVETFGLESIGEGYLEIYRELLEDS